MTDIVKTMQSQLTLARFDPLLRWLVPGAAVLAIAVWFYIAPPGLLGKMDALGYAICHRIDERSFHIGDRQLPLCARCTGEFFAAAFGLSFLGVLSPRRGQLPSRGVLAVLVAFFLAFAIDGSNSYLYLLKSTSPGRLGYIPTLYLPNNTLRLFTGSGMGLTLAGVLYPIMNQTLWRVPDKRRVLDWKSLGLLVGGMLVLDLLILTESPLVLYPVAVLSTLGVLGLLVIVFAIFWITVMRQENAFENIRQLWLPASAGLTLALLLILSIDFVRFQLTGTWSGFPGLG
ncbi:MAG TPA: DUF2085 domain-containing protein [Anaerolineales bacterium]